MARLRNVEKELAGDREWPQVKDTERAYLLASLVFAKHYANTSVMHRFADARAFADKMWKGEGILEENHPRFIFHAVIESVLNERMLSDGGRRVLVDLFLVHQQYFLHYRRTLRQSGTPGRDWEFMISRFSSRVVIERIAIFEELICHFFAEGGMCRDVILAELAPHLGLESGAEKLVTFIGNQVSFDKTVPREVWEAMVELATEQVRNEINESRKAA